MQHMSCTRTSGYPKVPAIDELREEINSGFQQALSTGRHIQPLSLVQESAEMMVPVLSKEKRIFFLKDGIFRASGRKSSCKKRLFQPAGARFPQNSSLKNP